ncbi:glycoside hydrolase family 3 N-terminal domain-containing protein [Cohnella lubricantis]|uniref:beta-N-acetylhexosaminidase n=1 Tax=Cohnella lubricantis TaxID=2163172 RepID=A0A841T5I3_9BACL|nr:glycoside hydrolase family 3 N-terminal domain-containing protein [Cohnella lubricantis]MBB6676793.1 S-layer homology domain-containing protein [Cohnella lubricantis]MBP2118119.1 beta-N-acetylhexosaminidase [Cohnella lubricantis]
MKLKLSIGLTVGIVGALGIWTGSVAAQERFTDLKYSQWAADSIEYMADRGTVSGYGNGLFGPSDAVTRAQAIAFLVRELQPQAQTGASPSFTDVSPAHPFYDVISVASQSGLARGFTDGTFRPDEPISRAETAAFLTRAYELTNGTQPVRLSDIEGSWASDPIRTMSTNGLIGGYSDGTYRPDQTVTRAEFAVFLARVIHYERNAAIETQDWDKLMSYMTVSEEVGQMLMPKFQQWNGKSTTAMNAGLQETLNDQHPGGFILFENNIIDAKQVATFTHDLQTRAGDIPLFLGTDQEGGVIKRLPGGTNLPGQMALGAVDDADLARAAGQLTGEEMQALGLQLNFAPSLDVNSNPDNPIIGIRSFGSDPDLVSRLGLATMQGLQQSGVIAAVKHFPGHGDTSVDSHLGLPVLNDDRARLDAVELKPFRAAIDAGVDMIMTAHIALPAVDDEHAVSRKDGSSVPIPATLSKKVLTGLLREELGFQGVIISDAFTMQGIAEHFGEEDAVVRAVSAGVDIILTPKDSAAAHETLVKAVKNGTISEDRIQESVRRILELKFKYGLFDQGNDDFPARLSSLPTVIGSAAHRQIEREIAERAATTLAGPIESIRQGDHVVIAAADEDTGKQLEKQLAVASASQHLTTEVAVIGQAKTTQAMDKADYVILASYQFRNVASQFGWAAFQDIIDRLNAKQKRYSLLSLGNPYELLYLQHAKSALAVYGKQEPNLAAGLNVLLGKLTPQGVLPVQVK